MKSAKDLSTSRELVARYCFTCGKLLERHRYRCTVCGEMSCSRKCAREHLLDMDGVAEDLGVRQ